MSAPAPMVVNCVAYDRAGRRVAEIEDLGAISDVLAAGDRFVWVGLHEPDAALLDTLKQEFGLHNLAVEDAHNAHQRPKIETYGESLFVVVQTAQLVAGAIAFGETHVFMGANYLVSVRHGASLSYAGARRSAEQSPELLGLGPSYALYAVLDFIVDNLMPIVDAYRVELRELEGDIFAAQWKRDSIRRLYEMQRELMTLRLALAPLQDILSQLVRLYPTLVRDETRVYFRDVFDHVSRLNETVNAMREMLGAAMTVSLSLVTVRQNEVVKRLAGWAALLAAPTLIASWYGMNFRHMPELDSPWAYPVIIGITATICGGLFVALRRAHWL